MASPDGTHRANADADEADMSTMQWRIDAHNQVSLSIAVVQRRALQQQETKDASHHNNETAVDDNDTRQWIVDASNTDR